MGKALSARDKYSMSSSFPVYCLFFPKPLFKVLNNAPNAFFFYADVGKQVNACRYV